ncbi:2,3-diketo-5-methylthio-1-phosphopentane phosphatase [Rugosibacter aromaticivorans]|uniref:2,3-diketo-5-methylthio-1-phosphopentane phosphatase n=1 Tax=Rugosibacter aromaticivorans TaxID=1565605 RepID=A0A0C5IYG3_9PROT|nr:MtnX-like HAD-IB family phosphatase [Rugosibacter aromaticivorans]AJP47782.1 2,3-diketo-5-methylthio-1-phosphopentane phosphatase [Rugosibacter aromaticivorans]
MLFIVDFDGTLSLRDTVDAMLERFADPEWKTVEQEWLDGRITAVQCMQKQLRMVKSNHVSLEKFFREIQLDASFLSFYKHVSQFSKVAIVSDGLGHAIRVAMKNAALPELPVYANKLHFVSDGIDISWPHMNPTCCAGNGVCKCAVANDLSGGSQRVILVGDGKSDACLAKTADVVFAKGSLMTFCKENAIPHIKFRTFADVLSEIRTWPQETPQRSVGLAS